MIDKHSWRAMLGYRNIRLWGGVSGAKGDDAVKRQENAQANFTSQLMGAFQKQFGQQSGILSFLSNKLQPMIDNPQGFSPEAMAAMRTQATEGTAQNFAQSQKALQNAEAARGGNGLPSGVDAQLSAENSNAAAQQNSQAQNGITLANEQQKQTNFWGATNALNGVAAQLNPNGYASNATGGSEAVGNLAQIYKATQASPWLGAMGGLAGGALSAAGQAGGFGPLFHG
jgi:hypothetical protein